MVEPTAASEPAHLLAVEQDPGMRRLMVQVLTQHGFRVIGVRNASEMWDALSRLPIDLILLDVVLPGTNGMDVCRTLRERSTIPIIVVSARASESDRVLGLELGADDYLPKPFGGAELVARIRAVLRRAHMAPHRPHAPRERYLLFADWRLDRARREVVAPDGSTVELSGAEYDTLLAFLEHPQRVLAREQLLEFARNRLTDTSDRSVDVLVSRLRRKLEPDPSEQQMIKTIRGAGYMFIPDVNRA